MQAAAGDQLRLLDVQEIDSEIARLRHRLGSLPELERIGEARKAHQAVSQELVAARTQVSDLAAEEERAEADVELVKQRMERNQQQANDGSVSDPKALSSLLSEIEHLTKRLGDLEDAQLEVMERVEAARAAEQQAADELARIAAEGRRLMASKDEKTAGLGDEIAQQETAREQALAGLPADLMTLYERIRSKSGVGAAMLRRGRCEGCRLQLTNEDMGRIRSAGPDTVLRCPECDRILVRTAESGL